MTISSVNQIEDYTEEEIKSIELAFASTKVDSSTASIIVNNLLTNINEYKNLFISINYEVITRKPPTFSRGSMSILLELFLNLDFAKGVLPTSQILNNPLFYAPLSFCNIFRTTAIRFLLGLFR